MNGEASAEKNIVSSKRTEDETQRWEKRIENETPAAFRAFSLYRSMGYKRSIKGCLELHNVPDGKYGSWSRWSRKFDWKERAAEYDEYCAKKIEQEIIAEHTERKKRIMAMLDKVDGLVDKRLDTLDPETLDADRTMNLLERSAKLDGYVSGTDREKDKNDGGQLLINFVDSFDGV